MSPLTMLSSLHKTKTKWNNFMHFEYVFFIQGQMICLCIVPGNAVYYTWGYWMYNNTPYLLVLCIAFSALLECTCSWCICSWYVYVEGWGVTSMTSWSQNVAEMDGHCLSRCSISHHIRHIVLHPEWLSTLTLLKVHAYCQALECTTWVLHLAIV